MHDVIVIGGGFAGVTAAREAALRGRSVLLLEARDRLGGRTWTADWHGSAIEYGGAWVHWHQPHTWSEITRAGLRTEVSDGAQVAAWYVGEDRRSGSIEQRDEIARRGWDRFVDGVREALPMPHDPTRALGSLARFDRQTIAERLGELNLSEEERDVLTAELESLAHAPLDQAGAVSVLRWHALSGYSLELTQFTGGRVTLVGGTRALLGAIADGAAFERRLGTAVAAIRQRSGRVEIEARDGSGFAARAAVVAVPLNALGAIEFAPALAERQASRDRARPGVARDQDLHPRPRRATRSELDPARTPVRLPRHRIARRERLAAHDRLRDRRRALRRRRPARGSGPTRRTSCRAMR